MLTDRFPIAVGLRRPPGRTGLSASAPSARDPGPQTGADRIVRPPLLSGFRRADPADPAGRAGGSAARERDTVERTKMSGAPLSAPGSLQNAWLNLAEAGAEPAEAGIGLAKTGSNWLELADLGCGRNAETFIIIQLNQSLILFLCLLRASIVICPRRAGAQGIRGSRAEARNGPGHDGSRSGPRRTKMSGRDPGAPCGRPVSDSCAADKFVRWPASGGERTKMSAYRAPNPPDFSAARTPRRLPLRPAPLRRWRPADGRFAGISAPQGY